MTNKATTESAADTLSVFGTSPAEVIAKCLLEELIYWRTERVNLSDEQCLAFGQKVVARLRPDPVPEPAGQESPSSMDYFDNLHADAKATEAEKIIPQPADMERAREISDADFREVMKALEDLSFECCRIHTPARSPSIEVYNRTFEVLDKHRKRLGWRLVPW